MATQDQAKMETLICTILNLYGAGRGSRRAEPIQISDPECKLAINHLIRCYGFFFLHTSPNAISKEAEAETDKKNLTLDHVVPLKQIMKNLMDHVVDQGTISRSHLRGYLAEHLLVCKITKDEDKRLTSKKLGSRMPDSALDKSGKVTNLWARYAPRIGANIPCKPLKQKASKKKVIDIVTQEI